MKYDLRSGSPARATGAFAVMVTACVMAGFGVALGLMVFWSLGETAKAWHGAAEMVQPLTGRTLAIAPDRGA